MRLALATLLILPTFVMFAQTPVAQRSAILVNTVKRGDVVQVVRGLGVLKAQRLAEVRISEMYAQQIKAGQKATVDTGKGTAPARVAHVDNAIVDGTVRVELQMDADPPSGVSPGKSVDGTIVLLTMKDVMYVGGPTPRLSELEGQSETIFRLEPNGSHASRVRVEYGLTGRSAGETRFDKVIVIRSGLQVGNTVILSDMSTFKGSDRVRLQ